MSRLSDVFKQGDVLFGIPTSNTIAFRDQFSKKFPDFYCYIDPYIHGFIGFVDRNLLGRRIEYKYGETPQSLATISKNEHIHAFRQYFEMHPKYDPRYIYNTQTAFDFSQYVLRLKRACKAWVEWTVTAEKPLGRIHVLLDGVNMQRIFSPTDDDIFFRAELKKMFKLFRSDHKACEESIFFWKEGKRVNPPWDDINEKSVWMKYEAYLQRKNANNNALTAHHQKDIRNKIYANSPSGEVTSALLLKKGLFSPQESVFVERRRAAEKRSCKFTTSIVSKL